MIMFQMLCLFSVESLRLSESYWSQASDIFKSQVDRTIHFSTFLHAFAMLLQNPTITHFTKEHDCTSIAYSTLTRWKSRGPKVTYLRQQMLAYHYMIPSLMCQKKTHSITPWMRQALIAMVLLTWCCTHTKHTPIWNAKLHYFCEYSFHIHQTFSQGYTIFSWPCSQILNKSHLVSCLKWLGPFLDF